MGEFCSKKNWKKTIIEININPCDAIYLDI